MPTLAWPGLCWPGLTSALHLQVNDSWEEAAADTPRGGATAGTSGVGLEEPEGTKRLVYSRDFMRSLAHHHMTVRTEPGGRADTWL